MVASAALGGLLACGVPGEPLPPLLEIPELVQDLTANQVGSQVRLSWSRPLLTTEGSRVREPARMQIYGASFRLRNEPVNFPAQATLLATLPGEEILSGPSRIVYELPLAKSQIGEQTLFAVKAVNHRGKDAGFSNLASLEIIDLPEPPRNVEAMLTENAIRLSWRAGERSVFAGPAPPADGYQAFRAEAGLPASADPIGTSELPQYEDSSFEFGHTYLYSVRAFRRQGDAQATTPPSASVPVVAADRFPPTPPKRVRAVSGRGAVELAWSPNPELDLAGYNVYRSEARAFERLNRELLEVSMFRDESVVAEATYRYKVTAVDRNGNESPPEEEIAVTAQ